MVLEVVTETPATFTFWNDDIERDDPKPAACAFGGVTQGWHLVALHDHRKLGSPVRFALIVGYQIPSGQHLQPTRVYCVLLVHLGHHNQARPAQMAEVGKPGCDAQQGRLVGLGCIAPQRVLYRPKQCGLARRRFTQAPDYDIFRVQSSCCIADESLEIVADSRVWKRPLQCSQELRTPVQRTN